MCVICLHQTFVVRVSLVVREWEFFLIFVLNYFIFQCKICLQGQSCTAVCVIYCMLASNFFVQRFHALHHICRIVLLFEYNFYHKVSRLMVLGLVHTWTHVSMYISPCLNLKGVGDWARKVRGTCEFGPCKCQYDLHTVIWYLTETNKANLVYRYMSMVLPIF